MHGCDTIADGRAASQSLAHEGGNVPLQSIMMRFAGRALLLFLALAALCLPLLQPFTLPDLPLSDDGAIHLVRAVALDHSQRVDGAFWPRYSSGLAYGFGAPLFNYYAPLNYMPQVLLHHLGLSFLDAWKLTMMIIVLVAALGAYRLGALRGGAIGGLLLATAYVYAPYFVFDLVTRGTTTEVAALALLPWALWSFERLARHGGRRRFLVAALAFALFIPLHNITTLFGTALLALFSLVLVAESNRRRATFFWLLSAGLMAFALTAFFWLPALGETSAVKINAVTENLAFIDVTRTLRPLGEIFAPPATADPVQLQAERPIVVGWPQAIAALIAALVLIRQRRSRLLLFSLTFFVAGMLFLNLEASADLWRSIPFIGYSQFAWRTIGPASLGLAWIIALGASSARNAPKSRQKAVFLGFLLSSALWSIPWLYTPYRPFETETIQAVQDFERERHQPALSSYGEYLPATNQAPLDPELLRGRFASGEVISRLTQRAGVELLQTSWQGSAAELHLRVAADTALQLDWLYMPGWVAELRHPNDAIRLPVRPSIPDGLLEIDLPAGEYALLIWRERTPMQASAEIASLVAALALAALALSAVGRATPALTSQSTFSDRGWLITAGLLGVAVFVFKAAVLDHSQTPFRAERFEGGVAATLDRPGTARFQDGLALLRTETPQRIHAGEFALLRSYWTLYTKASQRDYSSFAHLRNAAGRIVWEGGSFQPGGRATSQWIEGLYLEERIPIEIPAFIPPGTYSLELGLYDSQTLTPLSVLNATGNPVDARLAVGLVEVLRPAMSATLANNTALATHAELTIHRLEGIQDGQQSGEILNIDWLWSASGAPDRDWRVALVWINEEGATRGSTSLAEPTPGFSTSAWRTGDVWQGSQRFYVPGDLESGRYVLALDWSDEDGEIAARTMLNMTQQVNAPMRNYTLPKMEFISHAAWQNGLRLLGYSIDDSVSKLTLVWATEAPLHEDLRLFVHLLDGERIIDQHDGVPVDWTRPTTGWAQGEIIQTEHIFNQGGGSYHVRLGWYQPDTGQRVLLDTGADALDLDTSFGIP